MRSCVASGERSKTCLSSFEVFLSDSVSTRTSRNSGEIDPAVLAHSCSESENCVSSFDELVAFPRNLHLNAAFSSADWLAHAWHAAEKLLVDPVVVTHRTKDVTRDLSSNVMRAGIALLWQLAT